MLQVAVGRRNDANVDATGMVLADTVDLARLQRSQDLRLQLERNLADLVQEQCAPICRLELAWAIRIGSSERTLAMPEQFCLDE